MSCLRDNDGLPFTSYLLGRSCFLCAHCVNKRSFRHPTEMECTLDSTHGCFYEKRGFTKQREAEAIAAAATAVAAAGHTQRSEHSGEDSKAEVQMQVGAVGERGRADGMRLEEEPTEQTSNGHAQHTNRRSTRTSADKDSGAAAGGVAAAAASANSTASTSVWPAVAHNHAASSAASPSLDASTAAGAMSVEEESLEPKKAKRRGIRDADKKSKAKLIPRCTSPSHFLVDDSTALGPAATSVSVFPSTSSAPALLASSASASQLPSTSASSRHIDKLRTDALLSSIASMYYRPRVVHPSAADVYVSADYDRFEYPTVDALLSPLRKPSVLDDWTPIEVALFESGICSYGKDFHAISRLMAGRKTCGQCVEFYYVWKKSGHYALWKEFGKPVRRRTDSKAEQWRAVEERMAGLSSRHDDETAKRKRAVEAEDARERQRTAAGDNGAQDKKPKTDSGQQQHAASVKMEDDGNVGSGRTKAEVSVSASSSIAVS